MSRQPTKAMLQAKVAAQDGYIDQLEEDLRKLQRRFSELEAKYKAQNGAGPRTMREAMAHAKALAMQGVPCRIRNGVVVHALTGAVL